jgi:hypothetical protein
MKNNLHKITSALLIYLGCSMTVALVIGFITYTGWHLILFLVILIPAGFVDGEGVFYGFA